MDRRCFALVAYDPGFSEANRTQFSEDFLFNYLAERATRFCLRS